jgi:hypothetical protein
VGDDEDGTQNGVNLGEFQLHAEIWIDDNGLTICNLVRLAIGDSELSKFREHGFHLRLSVAVACAFG